MRASCAGALHNVANEADQTISALSVDAATGAIASVAPPATIGLPPYAIAGTSDKKYLYVANGGSKDVSAFTVYPGSGALTTVPGSPFAAGTNPRALALFGSTLVVANAGSSDLSVYSVESTGIPKPLSPASYATGAGPSAMVTWPGYNSVLLAAGSNDISMFWIGPGGLEQSAGSRYPSGGSVSSLAFGRGTALYLYAANAASGAATISGFNFNSLAGAGGELTSLPGFPYALPSCNSIVADQTGAYLYATAGTNLFGYSIDQGWLRFFGQISTSVKWILNRLGFQDQSEG